MIRLRQSNLPACDSISEHYGSEDDDDVAVSPKNSLDIPPIEIYLSEDCLEILKLMVNPLSQSESCGIVLYERTLGKNC